METHQIFRTLDAWGVRMRLADDQVIATPTKGLLDAEQLAALKYFKPAIVDRLMRQRDLEHTAAKILQLTDAEFADLRAELQSAAPADPHITFDRQAFALAEANIADRVSHQSNGPPMEVEYRHEGTGNNRSDSQAMETRHPMEAHRTPREEATSAA